MLKIHASRLYVITWQTLRVCAGLLLAMRAVLYAGLICYEYTKPAKLYEPPPVVCGKMAGEVYEFSRLYFPFWPEYEERSSKRSYYVRENDCDINIASIFIAMSWPGLEPAENHRIHERLLDRGGLLVAVTPIVTSGNDLRQWRDQLLEMRSFGEAPIVVYDSQLGLYRDVGNDYSWGRRNRRIFWKEERGVVTSVTICNWQAREPDFYACEMMFLMNGILKVQVTMSPEKFEQWHEVRRAIEAFLVSSKKAG
ncbi:hypothetical protein [Pseudomonas sp. CC120222-01a]|uniref:hypothetical protein n=1 Tax=Pseudomonas sp. CC120222-01a TaxID=1378075 RepID=UPI000D99F186|nr:hypothetical protein [Pseudomonas sp. CC120222-01a]PVZ42685.1 hypothetical protein N430_01298 [Pseudomonas sp. CC120222-01a]